MYAGLEDHEDGLTVLLGQEFPEQYKRFAAHLLIYEHELLHIEAHTRQNGHHIQGIGLDSGYFLMYYEKCESLKFAVSPRPIPAILGHIERISI